MGIDVEALLKPVSALSEADLADLKARIEQYKRTGAIIEQGPFDTRTFIDVNDDTVRRAAEFHGLPYPPACP